MKKVLVFDANQRSALAVVRSLGKQGVPLIVADTTPATLAGYSKYCQDQFIYPSPETNILAFLKTVQHESRRRGVEVFLPVKESTIPVLLQNRQLFSDVALPFVAFDSFERLRNKWALYQIAQTLQIPTPQTRLLTSADDLRELQDWRFPLVLKPCSSTAPAPGTWQDATVRYVTSPQELRAAWHPMDPQQPLLVQEYIKGHGQGIFALYNHGRPLVFFAHKRLREKPPSGGVSVLSESIQVDPYMQELSQRILEHVEWHGVAMVEFKVASDGTPYLMEVNPRFWGSLQLAIDAGVDFPWLLYQLAVGKPMQVRNTYTIGTKNRWLLGDLDHLYLVLKNHSDYAAKWQAIRCFCHFFEPHTHYEVNRWDDLKPFLFELRRYLFG